MLHSFTSADSHIRLAYDAGDTSAVWRIGDTYCKVKLMTYDGITRENATSNWLQSCSLSFEIPEVLYHFEDDTRSYLFISELPGQTLAIPWPDWNDTEKYSDFYVMVLTGPIVGVLTQIGI